MKKLLLLYMCLMALLCSCSKDNDPGNGLINTAYIYGHWSCVLEQHANVETGEIYQNKKHQLSLTFYEDGICSGGKYQITGNTLIIEKLGTVYKYTIKELTENRLVIQRIEGNSEKQYYAIYTYEKTQL